MLDIKNLEKALESIVFNKTDLNNLKSIIKDVASGKTNDKLLREEIVKTRIKLIKYLMQFIEFFVKSIKDTNEISIPTNALQEDLQEKDALLEQLGQRLTTIYTKLTENGQMESSQSSIDKLRHNTQIIEIEDSVDTELAEKSNLDDFIFINNRGLNINKVKFVIDGSNIARYNDEGGEISNLYQLIHILEKFGIQTYNILCDANLYHTIDNREEYQYLIDSGKVEQTPAMRPADLFVLEKAKKNDAYMITNDKYQEYWDRYGKEWILERRVTIHFSGDEILFPDIYFPKS